MAAQASNLEAPGEKSSAFERAFDEQTRHRLRDDDRLAWRIVCGELFAIVLLGLLLGICAVLLATW